jgi:hypothetical protein
MIALMSLWERKSAQTASACKSNGDAKASVKNGHDRELSERLSAPTLVHDEYVKPDKLGFTFYRRFNRRHS